MDGAQDLYLVIVRALRDALDSLLWSAWRLLPAVYYEGQRSLKRFWCERA